MPGLGRAALALTLALLVYAVVVGGWGAYRGKRRLVVSSQDALVAAFVACAVATAVLLVALATHDYSIAYVADRTSRDLPFVYRLTALWAGQEGSLLLWLLVLTGFAAGAVLLNRKLVTDSLPLTAPILGLVGTFFALVLVAVSSPFATQPAPADGAGLTPSLQNPYMAAHPPLLYLGYVGLTIPFAFAMASVVARQVDERWIIATRRWMLATWACLGFGILLGAKWAYEEIGWGGWYAWDPVENAALMPWLVGTAFLHSVMVQEKKDMLRVWNVVLIAMAFCLSVFGTFLTRSGILNSIHSFAESSIGAWFLGFIVFIAIASLVLILWRLPHLRARTRMESLVSREAAFLYNNLFLVAFALTVLWGVVYPLVSEAIRGTPVTVSAPYFDFFGIVFGLPLVLLMGIGPLVAWRRSSLRTLARQLLWPGAAAVAVAAVLAGLGASSAPAALVGYSFGAFALAAIVLEFARGTRARRSGGERGWLEAFTSLVERNRRRYGGYVVHVAVILLLIGAAGIGGFSDRTKQRLAPGEALTVGDYAVRYVDTVEFRAQNALELRARLQVYRDDTYVGSLTAGKNRYFAEQQVSNEVGIRTDWLRAEDLLVNVEQFYDDGSVFLVGNSNPLVNLIWLAGIVFVLGSLVTLWPDAREQRRLARRFEGVASPVGDGSLGTARGA